MPPLAAVQHFPDISESIMQRQPRSTALRRAIYVHVSDLTSAYNIDHPKLEQELSRVLSEQAAPTTETSPDEKIPLYRRDQAVGSETSGSIVSVPQKRLQPPRVGYNLCLLVGKVNVVVDKFRVDRSRVRLAEVEVGDETGVVSLRARDDQIDMLQDISERSGAVVLRNCTLELYQGRHVRLAVTKWGKLNPYPDQVASTPPPPSKMNRDRNFSLIDLSVVASEMVDLSQSEGGYGHSRHRTPERDSDRSQIGSKHTSGRQQQFQGTQQYGRKGGRDRKQQRQQKTGALSQLPVTYQDSGPGGPVAGYAMPQFSGTYGETLDVAPYSYASPRPQEGSGISQSQRLLFQQYELQQRQMQQHMYIEQQERHRRMMGQQAQQGQQMQHSPVLLPANLMSTGSFEHGAEFQPPLTGGTGQHPSVVPVVGPSPVLLPMSVPTSSQQPQASVSAVESPRQRRKQTFGEVVAGRGMQREAPVTSTSKGSPSDSHMTPETAWSGSSSAFQTSRADSPASPGRMNPQATAFAPSYMASQQGPHQMPSAPYTYVPYDASQTAPQGAIYGSASQPHPGVYASQGVVYVPAFHSGGTEQGNIEQETEDRERRYQPIRGADPQTRTDEDPPPRDPVFRAPGARPGNGDGSGN